MSPMTVTAEARGMLEQLALPIDPRDSIKARRERAIRRAGISPAKGMRLWYGQACSLLAHEFIAICEAYRAHVKLQERALLRELDELRELREARALREQSYEMDLATPSGDLGAVDRAPS